MMMMTTVIILNNYHMKNTMIKLNNYQMKTKATIYQQAGLFEGYWGWSAAPKNKKNWEDTLENFLEKILFEVFHPFQGKFKKKEIKVRQAWKNNSPANNNKRIRHIPNFPQQKIFHF